jgi:hypothetical protein
MGRPVRVAVPARFYIEAPDIPAAEKVAERIAMALDWDTASLAVTGPGVEARPVELARCESCGEARHDGWDCRSESGVA